MKHREIGVIVLLLAVALSAQAGEIGFLEDFALAEDRAEALKQLIPGTEDYYYYLCLHYQNTGELDKVEDVLILGGGIIPEEDVPKLKESGIAEIFGPGTRTDDIVNYIQSHVKR